MTVAAKRKSPENNKAYLNSQRMQLTAYSRGGFFCGSKKNERHK